MAKRAMPTMVRNRPIVTVSGVVIDSALPTAIVFLSNPNCDRRRNFVRLCNRHCVGVEQLDETGSFMIAGGFENISSVIHEAYGWLVGDWHWTSNARVPGQSLSLGDAKKTCVCQRKERAD